MVRCKAARTRDSLVRLHIVAQQEGEKEDETSLYELDVSALCEELACRMRLLGGMAVEAPEEGISIVDVHRHQVENHSSPSSSSSVDITINTPINTTINTIGLSPLNVYEVVLRLPQATVLAVATLRAACVSMMEGALVEKKRKKKQQEQTVRIVPIAVRVVGLTRGS
ncbi:uncharacterized protein TM35_000312100 [Trypanosoma theileri]|uniref:Uncharacterized protein n=1 Tax=Trypanosoma theileri TaxID=67003 RepID=A0A1X0NMS1_9TRYP|nr:uncharacterized protein TM35_000312100 [Trypanosoma theileri]ORC86024.1 hypothetical protein TM35_000312100 [Trypanosoma theileri]